MTIELAGVGESGQPRPGTGLTRAVIRNIEVPGQAVKGLSAENPGTRDGRREFLCREADGRAAGECA